MINGEQFVYTKRNSSQTRKGTKWTWILDFHASLQRESVHLKRPFPGGGTAEASLKVLRIRGYWGGSRRLPLLGPARWLRAHPPPYPCWQLCPPSNLVSSNLPGLLLISCFYGQPQMCFPNQNGWNVISDSPASMFYRPNDDPMLQRSSAS